MYKKHTFTNPFKMSYLYKETIKAKPSEIPQKPHFCFLLQSWITGSQILQKRWLFCIFSSQVGDSGFEGKGGAVFGFFHIF